MDDQILELWLLDISGSMQGKRFDLLKAAVKQWKASAPHVKLLGFGTELDHIGSIEELDRVVCHGGTNLHLGLEYAAEKMCGRVIVFTDGEPHDEAACFDAAANVPGVVSAVFCGDTGDRDAIRFCEKLSRDNGGQSVTKDVLKGETLLCGEVQDLLGLPAPTAL